MLSAWQNADAIRGGFTPEGRARLGNVDPSEGLRLPVVAALI